MPALIPETDLILNSDGSIYHLGLYPEQLADLILTVGDPERVPKVSRYFDRIETKLSRREFCTHIGYVGQQRLMVVSSGIGTDNVEILLTELDALANVNLTTRTVNEHHRKLTIVRIGTSGSLQVDVPVDSYVINRYAFGLDTLMQFYPPMMQTIEQRWAQQLGEHLALEFTPYCVAGSDSLRDRWKDNYIVGTAATCPGFYAPQGRSVRIESRIAQLPERLAGFCFGEQRLTNLEMETAGYYALGRLLGHDVISLNAILANRATQKFSTNPAQTVNTLIQQVLDNIANFFD